MRYGTYIITPLSHTLATSVSDPDSIRSVDPYPESEYGFGSRRAKIIHINRKKLRKFHVLKCWMFSSEGLRLLL
jgi:hypothetical protein